MTVAAAVVRERAEQRLVDVRTRLAEHAVDDPDVRRWLADVDDALRDLTERADEAVDVTRQLAEARAELEQLERSAAIVADARLRSSA